MDRVLIVDDEENIRLTLAQALATLPVEVETAAGGDEALEKIEQLRFALILLDLWMPGTDGMDVLAKLRQSRPEIPVIIITAHGTVESAVEAMKLGAIEFLQKPFVPQQIRELVTRVLQRQQLPDADTDDYNMCFELAKRCLAQRHVDAAKRHLRKAISIAPQRPEAFNMLGAIHELHGDLTEALNHYRAAWNFDATYEPARKNLERATSPHRQATAILLGDLRAGVERPAE